VVVIVLGAVEGQGGGRDPLQEICLDTGVMKQGEGEEEEVEVEEDIKICPSFISFGYKKM